MLEETSVCTSSLTVETNEKWNSQCSGQTIHCAEGPVVHKGRMMSSLINTPWAQLCQPHCYDAAIALLLPITALQNRLALGTRRSPSWVAKHSSWWPCTHRDESGSTALSHEQPSEGGRWRSNSWATPAGAHLQFPELTTSLWGQLFPEPVPSFPTTQFCCWKILNQCCLTTSCSQCFPPQHWNVIAGKEVQEKKLGTNSRQDFALKLHHFSELLLTWLGSHPDLCETWLTLCSQLNESQTVRQGLNSAAQFKKVFPGFVTGVWGASTASVFWL